MKKIFQLLLGTLIVFSGLGVLNSKVFAQAATACQVSGDYGSFSINEANHTVTARFSVTGAQNCTPVQVSIAVWTFNQGDSLQNQVFFGGNTGTFGYLAVQPNQAQATHSITTAIPTSRDKCMLQIDLVRGGQRADPGHQFPNGPFYDGRRLNTIVTANPACRQTETITNEVIREVPREVVREVPVERVVTVDRPVVQSVQTRLPNTGPSNLLVLPALSGAAAGVGHFLYNRRKI